MPNLIYKFRSNLLYDLLRENIMNKIIIRLILFTFFVLQISYSQSVQQYFSVGNLELVNGQTIDNCNIGYRTFGKLNRDSTNAIIFPTWFEGTTNEIGRLIQKYSFLDTTKYFIIAIDALGDGISSSPSNYNVYKIKSFPEITIRDIVNSQYKLVTKLFGLKHLFAAVGGSLGGMQVLEWAVTYPDFIDKIVSYVSTPKLSSYELLWMNTQVSIIEMGKKYGVSEQETRKTLAMLMAGLGRTPDYLVDKVKPGDFDLYLKSFNKEYSQTFTLEDYYSQIKAILNHNIYNLFDGSMEETAKHIKSKLFFIISETDLLVNPTEIKKFAKTVNAKTLLLNNNCGHLAVSCEIERCRKEIEIFLSE
jgi:homoserine O-acetyltransferase/O-succinyltransferase